MRELSAGKFRGFTALSNDEGIFQILALDQRNSLKKLIEEHYGSCKDEDIKAVKKAVTKNIAPEASAILLDGEYALPQMIKYIPKSTGIILSLEKSGYVTSDNNGERLSMLYREDAVKLAKSWGVDAVKLLIYWVSDIGNKTKDHQRKLVERVGKEAKDLDILLILEILTYGQNKGKKDEILKALSEFSDGFYNVDLFKIEPFKEEVTSEEIYEATKGKPWVVLSGGMDVRDFVPILKNNVNAGASGFLAGRVVWKRAASYIRKLGKMDEHLSTTGIRNISLLKDAVKNAVPWYSAPFFGGFENITILG
ncbi:MAG: tagatose 1,6-diphosphate aldolase [Thermotogaceae bacterium]|nr:tagatose 1,6-diphosphate aldolase [Thermotogaceae bacterium]